MSARELFASPLLGQIACLAALNSFFHLLKKRVRVLVCGGDFVVKQPALKVQIMSCTEHPKQWVMSAGGM